jgi:hypothetical protein
MGDISELRSVAEFPFTNYSEIALWRCQSITGQSFWRAIKIQEKFQATKR